MQGGLRRSRYSSDKFEQIKAEAQRDGEKKPRSSGEIADLVKDPVQPLVEPTLVAGHANTHL